jgi:hypothetical protein
MAVVKMQIGVAGVAGVAGVVGGAMFALTTFLGSATAGADDWCTNQIDYSGDPRSNAEINGIGASTGYARHR